LTALGRVTVPVSVGDAIGALASTAVLTALLVR